MARPASAALDLDQDGRLIKWTTDRWTTDQGAAGRVAEASSGTTAGGGGIARRRDTATPARQSAPPARVSQPGTSPRNSHDIRTTRAGTTYVVAPSLPALVRASAYAQVVNAIAVGPTPR